ncbi:MAG TPA: hypothetical protein DCF65_02085 [Chloroflexi bacterium]|jgi:hypothetical protein|nr:hypothetical protein [Chloroflexota bacterium]HAF18657.1 hypothetical protein [Chloroflexota bacterium]
MDVRSRYIAAAACVLLLAGCSIGSSSTFSLNNATVDQGYTCPVGAKALQYELHGTIDAHNGTSNTVTISAVTATMTLAAVKGGWLQKVGDKFDAGNVNYAPTSIGPGSSATIDVAIPSACTGRAAGSPAAWGDYAVTFAITSSAGRFKLDSQNKHRIVTA